MSRGIERGSSISGSPGSAGARTFASMVEYEFMRAMEEWGSLGQLSAGHHKHTPTGQWG
jgi:hypothetical protein